MKKFLINFGFTVLIAMSLVPYAFADTKIPPIIPEQKTETTAETLIIPHTKEGTNAGTHFQTTYLPTITKVIISLAGALAFLFVIIGGIQILTAYGEEEKISNAKKTITYAIVGLLVALLSYAIVSIIGGIQVSQVKQVPDAPGTQDMLDVGVDPYNLGPGRYGEGGEVGVIQGGVQKND